MTSDSAQNRPGAPEQLRLPPPIAFALGGGASLGAVQVGMLRALDEAGVRPDIVIGTSVGALNGAVLAGQPDHAVDQLEVIWSQLQRRDVFSGNLLSAVWQITHSANHVIGTEGIEHLAKRILHAEHFEDLQLPFSAVTLDLNTGRVRVLDHGPVLPALLASAAMPGLFAPVRVDGHLLVDGGTVANVPVAQAFERGAKSIVMLDCTVPGLGAPYDTVPDIISRVSAIQQRIQLETSLREVTVHIPVLSLAAPEPRKVSLFDFDHTAALVADTHRATRDQLRALTIDGPGLYGEPFSRYETPGPLNAVPPAPPHRTTSA